jgi:hypothetical protein
LQTIPAHDGMTSETNEPRGAGTFRGFFLLARRYGIRAHSSKIGFLASVAFCVSVSLKLFLFVASIIKQAHTRL